MFWEVNPLELKFSAKLGHLKAFRKIRNFLVNSYNFVENELFHDWEGLLWTAIDDACNWDAWFVVPVKYIHLGWADENNKYKHDNKNTKCNQSIINKASKMSRSTS